MTLYRAPWPPPHLDHIVASLPELPQGHCLLAPKSVGDSWGPLCAPCPGPGPLPVSSPTFPPVGLSPSFPSAPLMAPVLRNWLYHPHAQHKPCLLPEPPRLCEAQPLDGRTPPSTDTLCLCSCSSQVQSSHLFSARHLLIHPLSSKMLPPPCSPPWLGSVSPFPVPTCHVVLPFMAMN